MTCGTSTVHTTRKVNACHRGFPVTLAGCLLVGGCSAHAPSSVAPPSAFEAAAATRTLPLRLGFYVTVDVPCSEASNATLGLLHVRGLNDSRNECVFESMQGLGPDRYRIVERCTEIVSGESSSDTVVWEVLSPDSFRRTFETGWQSEMCHCEQSTLPEWWRDIDLDEAVDRG